MLFQNDCGGLEVESQRVPGGFVKVTLLKNAIVMNIGDLPMRWSNGEISSSCLLHC
jgi:isopenicillin N synthase-like dioxygenase